MEQVEAISRGEKPVPKVFQYQIAYNVIPQIGGFGENGYSSEEMKMQNEGRKILHLPELLVNCTCVRVPVVRSHSVSVTLVTERPISVEEARAAIAAAPRLPAGGRFLPTSGIPCPWRPAIRISCSWAGSAGILPIPTA